MSVSVCEPTMWTQSLVFGIVVWSALAVVPVLCGCSSRNGGSSNDIHFDTHTTLTTFPSPPYVQHEAPGKPLVPGPPNEKFYWAGTEEEARRHVVAISRILGVPVGTRNEIAFLENDRWAPEEGVRQEWSHFSRSGLYINVELPSGRLRRVKRQSSYPRIGCIMAGVLLERPYYASTRWRRWSPEEAVRRAEHYVRLLIGGLPPDAVLEERYGGISWRPPVQYLTPEIAGGSARYCWRVVWSRKIGDYVSLNDWITVHLHEGGGLALFCYKWRTFPRQYSVKISQDEARKKADKLARLSGRKEKRKYDFARCDLRLAPANRLPCGKIKVNGYSRHCRLFWLFLYEAIEAKGSHSVIWRRIFGVDAETGEIGFEE